MPDKDFHQKNRLSWNNATTAHNSHRGDQATFFREGGIKFHSEDLELLGDIRGLRTVHLQCNAGQDTLSLANMGANVLGVDISDVAIDEARRLSAESGVPAEFVRADIYDWFEAAAQGGERFDLAYCSYGALCWLSDINTWARGVAAILKPGGRLVTVEFHPVMWMYDEQLNRTYPFDTGGEPILEEGGIGDYVAQSRGSATYEEGVVDFQNPEPSYEWNWGIGQAVTALLGAGLRLTALREWTHANGFKPFESMVELPGRRWTLPPDQPNMPLMYGLSASRPD